MNRMDRLREYAKKLRTGPPGETKAQRHDRTERLYEAKRLLGEHDHVRLKFDVAEDPRVLEMRRRRLGNKLTDAEIRTKLQAAPDRGWLDVWPDAPAQAAEKPDAPRSPARQALARAADPEAVLHEKAWQDTDGPQEGWLGT